MALPMRPDALSQYQATDAYQVITADNERMKMASWLAVCQLGAVPDIETDYERYVDFVAAHNDLAREICARPI